MHKNLVPVVQPDGRRVAFYASPSEVDELIAGNKVFVRRSKKQVVTCLRLKAADHTHMDRMLRHFRMEHLQGVPVIRPHELIAPSPRRHFASIHSVYRDLRDSPHRMRNVRKKAGR